MTDPNTTQAHNCNPTSSSRSRSGRWCCSSSSIRKFGIFAATGELHGRASLVALAVAYVLTRHLPIMPLVTGVDRRGLRRR